VQRRPSLRPTQNILMPDNSTKATRLLPRPARARFLEVTDFDPAGGSTLSKVTALIAVYTRVSPILSSYPVGPLVKSLDLLGADINAYYRLQGNQRFFQNEIKAAWTVLYLASYVDLKRKARP
jgi:hypothetical protein